MTSFGPRYLGYHMAVRTSRKRRARTRSNPWYHYGSAYRANPGRGGTNWLLIGGIGVAAFFLLRGGALGSIFGGSAAPAGYSPIGGGYFRGPDGALYQQNPQTGGMIRSATQAPPGSSVEQQLIAAGSRLAMPLLTGGVSALGNWLGGLFSGSGSGSATGAVPSGGGSTADVLGVYNPGLAPLPALPELAVSDWWSTPTGSDWWNSSTQTPTEPGYSLWGGEGTWLPDLPPLEPSVSISWVDPAFVGGYEPSGFWGLGQRNRRLPLAGYGRVLRRGPTGEVESRFMRAPNSYR